MQPLKPYKVGSRYLLLMERLHIADGSAVWLITWELPLPNPGFCVQEPGGPWALQYARSSCQQVVPTEAFVHALRSFDDCFTYGDQPMHDVDRLSQSCPDEELHAWAERSPIHAWVAEKMLEQIRRNEEQTRSRKQEPAPVP